MDLKGYLAYSHEEVFYRATEKREKPPSKQSRREGSQSENTQKSKKQDAETSLDRNDDDEYKWVYSSSKREKSDKKKITSSDSLLTKGRPKTWREGDEQRQTGSSWREREREAECVNVIVIVASEKHPPVGGGGGVDTEVSSCGCKKHTHCTTGKEGGAHLSSVR